MSLKNVTFVKKNLIVFMLDGITSVNEPHVIPLKLELQFRRRQIGIGGYTTENF